MKKSFLLLLSVTIFYFNACSHQTKVSNTNTSAFENNSPAAKSPSNECSIEIKVRDKENNPVVSNFQVRRGEWFSDYAGSIKYNFICIQNGSLNEETSRTGNGPSYGIAPSAAENILKKVCFTLNNSNFTDSSKNSKTLDPQLLKVETYQVGSRQGATEPDVISVIKINQEGAEDFIFDFTRTYGSIVIDKVERQGNQPLVYVSGKINLEDQNFKISGNFKVLMKQR